MPLNSGFSLIELMTSLIILSILSHTIISHSSINSCLSDTKLLKLFLERQFIKAALTQKQIKIICTAQSASSDEEKITLKNTFLDCGNNLFWYDPEGVSSPRTIKISNKNNTCFLILSLRGQIRRICQKD